MHVEALKVSENGDAAGVKLCSVTSRKPKRLNVAVCRVGNLANPHISETELRWWHISHRSFDICSRIRSSTIPVGASQSAWSGCEGAS